MTRPRKNDYLWLMVTPDKYELPVLVCDSIAELSAISGKSETNIRSIVCKAEKKEAGNKIAHVSFRRVPKGGKTDDLH